MDYTMRWIHFIYYILLYSEKCTAIVSMADFTKIAQLEFNQIPAQHFCGISVINCASKCDADVECSAFNYNRGIRTCRLLSFDLFNQTAWPEFVVNDEWTVYVKPISYGRTTFVCYTSFKKYVFTIRIRYDTHVHVHDTRFQNQELWISTTQLMF